MKRLSLIVLLSLGACVGRQDPFFGRWTVEKVNVDFNEQIVTPEMVRQYGELEKENVIEISQDSVLVFVTDGDTLQGRCSLNGTQLRVDGKPFGRYENGQIETETATPLGKITVKYRK